MASILCFGEVLLRLSPPGRDMLLQRPRFDVHVGGAEANVAVALARLGRASAMLGVLPPNALGEAALGELRRHGVDAAAVARRDGRMGLYFYTAGALDRPGEVLYDRADSAFARHAAEAFDWPAVLRGRARLHLSGVTPALGEAPARAALDAARAARAAGVAVSFDGNYRGSLWAARAGEAPRVLRELMQEADVLFADHRDLQIVLGRDFEAVAPGERFAAAARAAFAAFPRLQRFTATQRMQHSVDHHDLGASLATREGAVHVLPPAPLSPIVDRIGTGDAFAAGVLHGLHAGWDDERSLRFGLAAARLKHSVPGDFGLADEAAVLAAMDGGGFHVRR